VALAILPAAILAALVLSRVPLCPMKNLLGIPCPGCGMTRAFFALLDLDLSSAVAFHPLAPIVIPLAVWVLGRSILVSAGLVSPKSVDLLSKAPKWIWWAFVAVLLGVYVARLAGGLGGMPDPIDPSRGLIGRAIATLFAS